MASTITLQKTLDGILPHIKYRPLAFPAATPAVFEPACTMANLILLTILGPPFAWRFNRLTAQVTFTCNPSQGVPTDYVVGSLSTFGWIENATVLDIDPNANDTSRAMQMTRVEGLAIASEKGRPHTIAPQYDDNAGNITFRVMPSPDQASPVVMDIQKKPVLFNPAGTPLTATWAPIPDEYSHLYTWGMLAMAMAVADDARWQGMNQKFVAALLATHAGLTENQKNIFLTAWMAWMGSPTLLQDRLQQGVQARGV